MSDEQQIGWAVLELMGHRKLAGRVEEATLAGGSFLRIDVYLPVADGQPPDFTDADGTPLIRVATQFYPPASVYCLTPTARDVCLAVAQRNQPTPVTRWELPSSTDATSGASEWEDDDELAPRGFE